MPVATHILGQLNLFAALKPDVLASLSPRMSLREYARRAVVTEKGSIAGDLGFLVNGRLQAVDFTIDGRGVGLYFVEPGDYFGELSLIDDRPAPEHVVAAVNSTVALLDAQTARQLIFGEPALAREVMVRMADRVRRVTAQRTLLGLPNPYQRLCVLLLQLAEDAGGKQHSVVPNVPTHQELAMMINASRETVTRAFQTLFAREALERQGPDLRLVKRDFLLEIAQGNPGAEKG